LIWISSRKKIPRGERGTISAAVDPKIIRQATSKPVSTYLPSNWKSFLIQYFGWLLSWLLIYIRSSTTRCVYYNQQQPPVDMTNSTAAAPLQLSCPSQKRLETVLAKIVLCARIPELRLDRVCPTIRY
jgi:hypothetical protein